LQGYCWEFNSGRKRGFFREKRGSGEFLGKVKKGKGGFYINFPFSNWEGDWLKVPESLDIGSFQGKGLGLQELLQKVYPFTSHFKLAGSRIIKIASLFFSPPYNWPYRRPFPNNS